MAAATRSAALSAYRRALKIARDWPRCAAAICSSPPVSAQHDARGAAIRRVGRQPQRDGVVRVRNLSAAEERHMGRVRLEEERKTRPTSYFFERHIFTYVFFSRVTYN